MLETCGFPKKPSPPLTSETQHAGRSKDPDEPPLPPDQVPQPPVREPRRRDSPGPPAPVKDPRPDSPRQV